MKNKAKQTPPTTIKGWFKWAQKAGFPWADAAMKNAKKKNLDYLEKSLSSALYSAFIWSDTDEGHEYWEVIVEAGGLEWMPIGKKHSTKTPEQKAAKKAKKRVKAMTKRYPIGTAIEFIGVVMVVAAVINGHSEQWLECKYSDERGIICHHEFTHEQAMNENLITILS